ncbi:hypothetical protein [Mycobacterium ostraviense]|uniref:hypothetical protein n=1 Tax=Mycobacterium ostraviense TaxID=2738409 RepID=UPI000C07FAAA|nr:hypothetical protein [Mycobacterium ostraviense]
MTTTPLPPGPLAGLRDCENHLLAAAVALAAARSALTGARHSRAVELAARLDGLISTCRRLATVVEGDARADECGPAIYAHTSGPQRALLHAQLDDDANREALLAGMWPHLQAEAESQRLADSRGADEDQDDER